jgi:hypothetical protein
MPYDAPKTPLHLRLNRDDDVIIALREIAAGTRIESEGVSAADKIPPGHKMATRAKAPGEPVRRYGQIIGFASVATRNYIGVAQLTGIVDSACGWVGSVYSEPSQLTIQAR